MKKLFLASALALASLASQAEEFVPVGDWDAPGSSSGGTTYNAPLTLNGAEYAATQTLFTLDQLSGIAPKGDQKVKIKSVSFKAEFVEAYDINEDGTFDITVFAENVSDTSFPESGNGFAYLPYGEGVKGTLSIDVTNEDYILDYGGFYVANSGDIPFTITFDEELIYDGKSILFTWFGHNALVPEDWFYGGYSVKTANKLTVYSSKHTTYDSLNAGEQSGGNEASLPIIQLECETVTVSNEPIVTEGDPTTIGIGEKDVIGNCMGNMPINPDYPNSISQSLYTKDLLGSLYVNDGASVSKANVTSFTTYIEFNMFYPTNDEGFKADVYVMNSDATSFPTIEDKEQWFSYIEGAHGTVEIGPDSEGWDDIYDYAGEGVYPVKVLMDEPFEYEGGSIVITWVMNSPEYDAFSNGATADNVYGFFPADNITHTATVTSNKASGEIKSGEKSKYLPYLDVDYFPVTYTGGEVKPMINVSEPVLAAVATADGTGNNITATFTIEDEANVGEYNVSVGTTKVGTFTGNEFTINYLPIPDKNLKDLIVYVAPASGDAAIEGSATIKAEDIAALFAAPTAEPVEGKQSMHGSFDYNAKNMSVNAAAQIHVNTTVPVANISFGTGASLLYGSDSNFGDLIPETATDYNTGRNLGANNYVAAFAKTGAFSVPVSYGTPVFTDEEKSVTVAPTVEFPIAKIKAGGYSLTADAEYEVPYSNKVTQSISNVVVKFTVSEENVTYTRSYPTMMATGLDDDNFIVYATQGHVIKYAICEYGDEAGELTQGGNAIEVVALESLKNKRIDYANVNEKGDVDKEGHMYFGEDGKEFTDIIEVSVPELSLIRVTDDKTGNSAIDIAAKFTFNDPKSINTHYISINGGEGHTLTGLGTEFEVHFLQYGDEDVNVTIKAAGTSPSMGWATISADAIKALFPSEAPVATLGNQDIHGFYDTVIPDAKTMDVTVAGQYTVTAAVPAVDVVFYDDNAQSFSSKHELGKVFGDLVSDVVVDDTHTVAFAQTFEEAVPVQYGWHITEQADIAASVTLTPTLIYPIAVVDNYAMSQYKDWYVAEPVDGATSFELGTVTLDINLADIDNDKYTREYAAELETRHDSEYFVIYAPEGHTVSYKVTNIEAQEEPEEAPQAVRALKAPAKEEYESTDENIVKLPMSDLKGKMVYYYSVDGEGNTHHDGYQVVEENGDVSGIFSIGADSFNDDVEYYNLQGVRVRGNLAPGFYIRRQGTSTAKVQVR